MAYEEEKRLSRELYSKYKFLRDIVALYIEGVTWRGCQLLCNEKDGTSKLIADISSNALQSGVQNMLIDGHGDYELNILGKERVITITMLPEYPLAGEEGGRPLLWTVTRNAIPLDTMMQSIGNLPPDGQEFVLKMLNDICSGVGIPYDVLFKDPRTFSNTLALKNILNIFKWRAKNIRRSVEFGLRQFAKQLVSTDAIIEVDWNDDWCSRDEYGTTYQIFKIHNIDLVTLRDEELATAKWAYENRYISRQTYDEKVNHFI